MPKYYIGTKKERKKNIHTINMEKLNCKDFTIINISIIMSYKKKSLMKTNLFSRQF